MKEKVQVVCCVCGRWRSPEGLWIEPPNNPPTDIMFSHGYCGPCGKQALAELQAEIKTKLPPRWQD